MYALELEMEQNYFYNVEMYTFTHNSASIRFFLVGIVLNITGGKY